MQHGRVEIGASVKDLNTRSDNKLDRAHSTVIHPPTSPATSSLPFSAHQRIPHLGDLHVQYFQPPARNDSEVVLPVAAVASKIHIKLSVVDSAVVLGSGNMDRASWFTSQELGILLRDSEYGTCGKIAGAVLQGLEGLLEEYHPRE